MTGRATNAVSLAMGGDATFNLASAYGVGFLEFSIGKSGVHSTIGMGGTNISYQNLKAAYGGLSEAKKVSDWKYDLGEEQKRTLNAINMLGYTNAGNNQQLAGEIWNGTKNVEYRNLDGEYGHFNASEDPNKVILSDALLGKGKEASAMLATVMSHEGTHVYGNRVEGVAHLAGLQTYSQLGEMFKLKGNKSFTESMENALNDENSWKENTGDVDYWKLMNDGTLVNDGSGWLVDENDKPIKNVKGKQIGEDHIEAGLLNILFGGSENGLHDGSHGRKYSSFTESEKFISFMIMKASGFNNDDPEMMKEITKVNWTETENKPLNMDLVMRFAGDKVATAVFTNYYRSTVDVNYAVANNILLNDMSYNSVTNLACQRYSDFRDETFNFYDSAFDYISKFNALKSNNYNYGPDLPDKNGKRVGETDFFHKGDDKNMPRGTKLNSQISGVILELDNEDNYDWDLPAKERIDSSGKNVNIEIGYEFEKKFISTGLQLDTFHMDSINLNLKQNKYYPAGTYIGTSGSTGFSTGAHTHTEIKQNRYPLGAVNSQFTDNFLKIMRIPGLNNYTDDANKWKNNMNFYSKTYDSIYLNTYNIWR